MEKVTGIGGLFFRAHDPKALGHWYQQHLGVSLTPSSYEESVWEQDAGPTVFSPLPETSDHFGDAHKLWMVNFFESGISTGSQPNLTNCRNRDQD